EVSTRRRTRITARPGRVTRMVLASVSAPWVSMLGPSTTTSWAGCSSRCRRSVSSEGRTSHSGPSAACSVSAVPGSRSTIAVMSPGDAVGVGGRELRDLGRVGPQGQVELAVLSAEDELLGLLLVDRQRDEGLGHLLPRP